ncbi:uncharacterized protein LOC112552818 [Pogonomyrmex barbatus]|uniref:Uncharacterized protein LOC112552818 n=1 Tax=Pogonomyrmex barbatus TaxID=144034 RepID=A0A8N1S7D2_9HYME|nr:uncharacterized protein LOC112552818 [Pogonomyrmex barbatus]
MSHIEDVQKWLEEVMSELIQNLKLNKARYEISESVDYTMSTLYYINIKYKNRTNGEIEELPVVLKSLNQSKFIPRRLNQLDRQIHNEILFYQTYAQSNDHFVKCLYADERSPCEVIVLENGCKRGYSSCPYSYDVPLEYTLAAFREMGRFHGKGYVMKELQPEKFFDIVKRIQEIRYETRYKDTDTYKDFVNIITPRAVEYLRRHGHDAVFCDKMEALLSNAFDGVMLKVSKPLEPLSTLCHGDFTASNVLFRKESDGQYRAILIDFAHFRYATPVVDLSTYLCLCCSNELRKGKFSEIMRAYHNALKEYLLEAGIWDIEKYSYEVLLDNFKKGALFGFAIASFFLGVLTGHSDRTGSEIIKLEYVERAKLMKQYGGDEISKILADMLLHLRDLGCLKHF